MNNIWRAIDREASSAAEHLAIGVTILGKANYAEIAYYGQAFFALSTGFERASKLIIAIDYSLVNGGEFPPNKIIRSYKHDLSALLIKADEIAGRHHVKRRLPDSVIHKNIITLLTQFADNITRYYNLDLITGDPKTIEQVDPIAAWFDQVILPIAYSGASRHSIPIEVAT
ncbi:MAG TPA: hypothetical protein PK587_04775 [Syntrophales bacterium]|nr:hypothetical protein [Syntrophales bacterium]